MKKIISMLATILVAITTNGQTIDINFEIANTEAKLEELKIEKDSIDKAYWLDIAIASKKLKTNEAILTRVWNATTLGYTDMYITYHISLEYVTLLVYHNDVLVKQEKYVFGITNIPMLTKTGTIRYQVKDPEGKEIKILRIGDN